MIATGDTGVLVTGASGFIGSALVRRLVQNDASVTATARGRLDVLTAELGVTVSHLDVMQELPSFDGIGTVVHCASPNDIMSRESDGAIPLAVMGTKRLLEHAAKHGVKRFIFLSTIQVFGTELSGTVDEATPVNCETLYGLNHYLGEEVCRFYAQTTDMDVVVLRPSNVYGVPTVSTVDRWTLVPMCFVREGAETGSVKLRSSGKQVRNFVSMDEVVDVICHVLAGFPAGFSIVNAASAWRSTIAEVAAMVGDVWQREAGKALDIQILSDQPENPGTFDYVSRVVPPILTPAESHKRMIQVIEGLIRLKQAH